MEITGDIGFRESGSPKEVRIDARIAVVIFMYYAFNYEVLSQFYKLNVSLLTLKTQGSGVSFMSQKSPGQRREASPPENLRALRCDTSHFLATSPTPTVCSDFVHRPQHCAHNRQVFGSDLGALISMLVWSQAMAHSFVCLIYCSESAGPGPQPSCMMGKFLDMCVVAVGGLIIAHQGAMLLSTIDCTLGAIVSTFGCEEKLTRLYSWVLLYTGARTWRSLVSRPD